MTSDVALLCAVFAGFSGAIWLAAMMRRGIDRPTASGAKVHRFKTIDGLRGYLALSVVAHHFVIWSGMVLLGQPWAAPESNWHNQLGSGAVALFFMITGFLFYRFGERGARLSAWLVFYIKRLFRLLPLISTSVALVSLVMAIQFDAVPSRYFVKEIVYWVTGWNQGTLLGRTEAGRANAYVLWSLWYEWVFYICLLPLFSLFASGFRGRLPAWVMPLAVIPLAIGLRSIGSTNPLWLYLPLFAVGMLVKILTSVDRLRTLFEAPAMGGCALAILAVGMVGFQTPYHGALPFFGFFFLTVACGNTLFGLLTTRGAVALGDASFGIYLLHGIILYTGFHVGLPLKAPWLLAANLPLLMAASAVMALGCFFCIERPAIALGAIFIAWATGQKRPQRRRTDSRKNAAMQKKLSPTRQKSRGHFRFGCNVT